MTLTNYGMVDFCDNAIKSLRLVGVTGEIVVGCTDIESLNHYADVENVTPFDSSFVECDESHQDWGTIGFRKVTQNKFPTIKNLLKTNEIVLYFDNDVFFKENPQKLIDNFKQTDMDIFIQSDAPTTPFCTGFFLIKSNKRTDNFVDKVIEKNNREQKAGRHQFGDQMSFIHTFKTNKEIVKLSVLERRIFPNGDALMKGNYFKDNYVIAHANYAVGLDKKRELLKSINGWLIADESQTV